MLPPRAIPASENLVNSPHLPRIPLAAPSAHSCPRIRHPSAMPVLPKSFHVLGAKLQSARTARQLKQPRLALAAQNRTFAALLPRLAATSVGRAAGITPQLSYAQFQSRVPLRNYEQLAPFIGRMQQGEADVLWPGTCTLFARTPGTDTGQPKHLPVTDDFLAHLHRASADAIHCYTARIGHCSVFRGRHLLVGSSSALTPFSKTDTFSAHSAELSGIGALNLPAWVERHLYEPGAAVAQIREWPPRLAALVARTRRADITLLAGLPEWLLSLSSAIREVETSGHAHPSNLHSIWPNLECVVHSGTPLGPFQGELRQALGPEAHFHEIYAATECIVAAQDADPASGLRLLADTGVFFEFLPLADFSPSLPPALAAKAIPLEGVRIDENYVLLVTTPGGLCRYVLGDVVRFTSTSPHRLFHVGRIEQWLNTFSENISEKDVTDALVAVCHRHRWPITHFHVAPLAASSLTGRNHGSHEWWVELKPLTVETPTGPLLAGELDTDLIARNPDYAARRRSGALQPPIVRLVMPGFFAHWMRHHHRIGDQHKLPRARNDRAIADELSAMACFNA